MSERKVINKYIPPNFDPRRVPRKGDRPTQHTVRLMAPFSMRCNSCGEFIYKGRKFNARKETVQGERYLGIRMFRFYIRCPTCANEIAYRTDPKNADYACESGARRNFEPWREEKAEEERAKTRKLLEELHNPMRALESKTFDTKREIEIAEALDDIRMRNNRLEQVDTDILLGEIMLDQRKDGQDGGLLDTTAIAHDEVHEGHGVGRNSEEEDDQIIREAFKKAQQQQQQQEEPTAKLTTKDLLLTSSFGKSTKGSPLSECLDGSCPPSPVLARAPAS